MGDDEDVRVGVTIRLTRSQLDAIDALVVRRNAKGGPTKANRQTMLAHFVDSGLKDAEKPR